MKEYTLTTRHGDTTVQLSDEDAEAYGDAVKPVPKKSKRPANKAAAPDNQSAAVENKSGSPTARQAAAAADALGAGAGGTQA